MKKGMIFIMAVIMLMAGFIYIGCSSKKAATEPEEATNTPVPAGPTNTPTNTATNTIAVTPIVFDNFEDGDADDTLVGGSWIVTYDTYGSSMIKSAVNESGQTGNYCMKLEADVKNTNTYGAWAWTSCAADVTPSAQAVDFNMLTSNGYTGLRIKYKGNLGTGSSGVAFLVQLVSNATTDFSKFRYAITAPSSTWTTINIPFKLGQGGFTRPNWGQAVTIPEADYYAQIRAIEFSIADFTSGAAGFQNTGNVWWIDDVTIY